MQSNGSNFAIDYGEMEMPAGPERVCTVIASAREAIHTNAVIASASEAIHGAANMDCFVAIAPLRKRFAFVAGNDERTPRKGPFVKIVDLSRELYHRSPSYPGHSAIIHGVWKTHEESFADGGNVHGLASMYFAMPDHGGTHIDAPRHFDKRGIPIDQYPLENCIVPGICLDLRHIAPRAEITPDDLAAAVKQSGHGVPDGGTVLLCTGHHERTFPRKEYATENSGVNVAATEWLAQQGIVHFGIDSMRPGPEGKENLLVHKACFELGITHIESLCNLEVLLGAGPFTFIGLPMKWRGGTGSPIRAVAVFGM
jgi:kynurenine formamidase